MASTYFSIAGNAMLAIIKVVAGYLGNSYALIADGIESTTDIFSSILVLIGIRYSNRPADENHPYGHGRAETLITFLVVVFLMPPGLLPTKVFKTSERHTWRPNPTHLSCLA